MRRCRGLQRRHHARRKVAQTKSGVKTPRAIDTGNFLDVAVPASGTCPIVGDEWPAYGGKDGRFEMQKALSN